MLYFLLICAGLGLLAAMVTGIVITRKIPAGGDFPYLLVLGSTVNGTEPSIMLSERIRAAYEYLTAHPTAVCIPTGHRNPDADIPEAECIARELVAMGIEEGRIWIEPNAASTRENLRFSIALIEEKTGKKPEIIGFLTSDFHVYRVRRTAQWLGIHAWGIGSKSRHTIFYYPAFLREILALWYYLLFVFTKKSPTP